MAAAKKPAASTVSTDTAPAPPLPLWPEATDAQRARVHFWRVQQAQVQWEAATGPGAETLRYGAGTSWPRSTTREDVERERGPGSYAAAPLDHHYKPCGPWQHWGRVEAPEGAARGAAQQPADTRLVAAIAQQLGAAYREREQRLEAAHAETVQVLREHQAAIVAMADARVKDAQRYASDVLKLSADQFAALSAILGGDELRELRRENRDVLQRLNELTGKKREDWTPEDLATLIQGIATIRNGGAAPG